MAYPEVGSNLTCPPCGAGQIRRIEPKLCLGKMRSTGKELTILYCEVAYRGLENGKTMKKSIKMNTQSRRAQDRILTEFMRLAQEVERRDDGSPVRTVKNTRLLARQLPLVTALREERIVQEIIHLGTRVRLNAAGVPILAEKDSRSKVNLGIMDVQRLLMDLLIEVHARTFRYEPPHAA